MFMLKAVARADKFLKVAFIVLSLFNYVVMAHSINVDFIPGNNCTKVMKASFLIFGNKRIGAGKLAEKKLHDAEKLPSYLPHCRVEDAVLKSMWRIRLP